MSTDVRWLENCCICCGAPTEPSMSAMRRDTLACRACLYIEGESLKNPDEWNTSDPPKLLGPRQGMHIFHDSSFLPVLDMFTDGVASDLWVDEDTVGYDERNFACSLPRTKAKLTASSGDAPVVIGEYTGQVTGDVMYFKTKKEKGDYRAVQWAAPEKLEGFSVLTDLIMECLRRAGRGRMLPTNSLLVPGCKPCNDIMTQRATMAHLLVRNKISDFPLVPLESILSVELLGTDPNKGLTYPANVAEKYRWDPNDSNKNGDPSTWTSQACYAYYAHRCLPERPAVLPPKKKVEAAAKTSDKSTRKRVRAAKDGGPPRAAARVQNKLSQEQMLWKALHHINVALSLIILEIVGLTFERYKGSNGGDSVNSKAAYRYRGVTEVYLAYVFWILLWNDNAHDGTDKNYCTLGFAQFFRYMFSEFLKVLVASDVDLAAEFEISDAIFGKHLLNAGNGDPSVLQPGGAMLPPDQVIGYACRCIVSFYNGRVKPIFSRHVAGLRPSPTLLIPAANPDATKARQQLYMQQICAYNTLIEQNNLNTIMHLLERATLDDVDSFVDSVGIHAVMGRWQELLMMAPTRIQRLLTEYTDTVTLTEYQRIRDYMRPDEFQPAITNEAAECIYLMCNAMELPSEPDSTEEVELLRVATKCSWFKSVLRLYGVGAVGSATPKGGDPANMDDPARFHAR